MAGELEFFCLVRKINEPLIEFLVQQEAECIHGVDGVGPAGIILFRRAGIELVIILKMDILRSATPVPVIAHDHDYCSRIILH